MEEVIVNKVAESGLITIDLEAYYPEQPIAVFDLKEHLFMELILKEKDFRTALAATDWEPYRNKYVGITCSADAIIPMWAYMLVASYLQPVANEVVYGNEKAVFDNLFIKNLATLHGEAFIDKKVVIKGCGDKPTPEAAFVEITYKLRPYAKSIMYGEPCSTVPIFKKKA